MYQDFNEFKQNFKNELAVELASANNPEISDARLFHVKLYTAMKNAKNNLGAEYNTNNSYNDNITLPYLADDKMIEDILKEI